MKTNSRIKVFLFMVAIILLLIFLNFIFKGFVQNTIFSASYFPSKIIERVAGTFSDGFRIVFSLGDILKENSNLREENNKLLKLVVDYDDIKEENKILRAQLDLNERDEFELLDARIVSFDPNNFSKFIIINKGLKDGVKINDPIILPGNILLGRVYEVYDDYSKVLFLTDKNNKVSVKSFLAKDEKELKRDKYTGVLSGYFGKSLFLDLVEKNAIMLKGDMIVTSGIDGIYPEGLIVGFINLIKDDDNAVFKQAYLSPAFLPFDSNFVFIIKSD